jgi:hypothetical protein
MPFYTHLSYKGLNQILNPLKYWMKGQYLMIIQPDNEEIMKNDKKK